jgi:hypothetical protein
VVDLKSALSYTRTPPGEDGSTINHTLSSLTPSPLSHPSSLTPLLSHPPPLSHPSSLAPFLLVHPGGDGGWTVVRDMHLRKNLSFSVDRVATAEHADDVCVREVVKCMARGRKAVVCCTFV